MNNSTTPTRALLRWLIAFASILLFAVAPIRFEDDTTSLVMWLWVGLLAALLINMGLIFTNRKLHPAYVVGMIGYLALGRENEWGNVLFVVGIGSLVGILTAQLVMRFGGRNLNSPVIILREAFQMAGQMLLALAAGMGGYALLDGQVPLETIRNDDILPLIAFATINLTVYLLLLRSVTRLRGESLTVRSALRQYTLSISSLLLIPIPFAFGAAYSYHTISEAAFWLVNAVMVLVVAGIYGYSRYQYRAEQQVRELTRLTRFTNAIRNSLDLESLLQTVYIQVSNLLNVSNLMMVLQQSDGQLHYLINIQNGQVRLVPRDSTANEILQYVVQTQTPLLISDDFAETVRQMNLQVPSGRIQSWLGVPLPQSERTNGALVVYSTSSNRRLNNDDRRRLSIIAAQVGVAVDNALMYEQSRTRAQQLRDLNEVGGELSSTLDQNAVLDMIVSAAKKIMSADGAAVFIWLDGPGGDLELTRAMSMSDGFVMLPPRPIIANRTDLDLIVVSDASQDDRVDEIWVTLANEGKRAWAEVLLTNLDEKLGILVVYYNEPQSQSQQDIEVLRTFASQAALAMSNARLYSVKEADLARRVEQLALLQRLSQALFLTTLKLDEMYNLVLGRATEGTDADTGALFLTREEAPQCVAFHGYQSKERAEKALLPLMEEVFHTGEMVLLPDTTERKDLVFRDDIRSQMAIPILHDIRVIGAILLESREPDAFGPEDMFFVMQVGTQARIAIDNVKLIQSIATTRDRLQAILNSMSEAIILISPDGAVSMANPQVRRLLHLDIGMVVNRSVSQLIEMTSFDFAYQVGLDPNDLRLKVSEMRTGRWRPGGERSSYDLIDGSRRRFIDRVDIPVEGTADTVGWMMVFLDVTEERELVQARTDLSNMIVHDLRGPLNAINMSLKLMGSMATREEGRLAETVERATETSQRAVRKMLNLVNSLLDVAKMESGTMELECEPTNIHRLTNNVLEELAPVARELDVELVNGLDSLPLLDVDADKVERLLLNLVDNALKFTPAEGKVQIQGATVGDKFLQIKVIDSGPGVPDEYKETLFDRYAQVKGQQGSRRGTGLGLAYCRLTVEAHGGRIWIEDNPNGGAIFTFTMPILQEELLPEE